MIDNTVENSEALRRKAGQRRGRIKAVLHRHGSERVGAC